MCQSTAYMHKEGREEQILSDVATIIPEGEQLRLINLFGEEQTVTATIERINLLEHKIILQPK